MSQTKIKAPRIMDASISTATVDIQVMRIGTKQMTLAVFRQLPEKDIFDELGYLAAHPWGWVNYESYRNARQFVFSHEGSLYRDRVELELLDFIVTAQVKGPYSHSGLTGKWIIAHKDGAYYGSLGLVFESAPAASAYLANRRASLAVLKDAPQLFIAV